jgi:hypothetical protein
MRLSILLLCVLPGCGSTVSVETNIRDINVSGVSDIDLRITYTVGYITQKNTPLICSDYNFIEGVRVNQSKHFTYNVNNTNGTYSINLPLSEMPPDTFCQWRPYAILYSVMGRDIPSAPTVEGARHGLISVDNKKGTVTDKIEFHCREIHRNTASFQNDNDLFRRYRVMCTQQGTVPSMKKTITPEMRSIVVNFS